MIGGSLGSVSIPDLRVWRHAGTGPDWWSDIAATTVVRGQSDPLVNQIRHFADVIRGKASPLIGGSDGLRTLQEVEALQQACLSGASVDIADDLSPSREVAAVQ